MFFARFAPQKGGFFAANVAEALALSSGAVYNKRQTAPRGKRGAEKESASMKKNAKRVLTLLLALVLCLGLLPSAVLAAPLGDGEFTITFNAAPGAFKDGTTTRTARTTSGGDDSTKHLVTYPEEYPERSGYVFSGWITADGRPATNVNFTADAEVVAQWDINSNLSYPLDAAGGTVSPDHFNVDEAGNIIGKLPTPTRPGYTFLGWYIDGKLVDESKPITSTAPFPVAQWKRASKVTPALKVAPSKIEAGAEKVEILLSCATDGAGLDWRPLERALYMDGKASDVEAAAKSYISGNFSAVGFKLTDVKYQYDIPVNDSAYPYALYPEGVYPTTGLTLTLEGAAKAGTLNITLAPGIFVQLVDEDEDTVLTEASADIFNAAQVKIPVGDPNPNGPYTVKFDLNYKDPPKAEIPKDQKVSKGSTVVLPDGAKLTCPFISHEFYVWCVKGTDGKLYPWKESATVTEDMTLYAGWVKKGAAVKTGQALPEVTEPSKPTTQNPETTVITDFHDVPANSPFLDSIVWAVKQGVTNGKTATTFGPGDPCTRAQIVTFLWRAAGSPEPKLTETEYVDVTDPGAYYYKAVQWAAELDMEYSGTFDPHDTCSRVAAVYFIWTAFGRPESTAKASFEDMQEPERGQWYWPDLPDAVDWAVEKGVTTGKTATTFGPGDPCTRGQIVTFLYRAYVK